MDFLSQCELIKKDNQIKDYLQNKNINLIDFIKKYIKIDEILINYFIEQKEKEEYNTTDSNINLVRDELDTIKKLLLSNNNSLENIQSNVLSSNITLLSSIERYNSEITKEITSGNSFKEEFKNILENFKEKIDVLSTKKLNDIDRKSLDVLSNIGNTLITSLDSHIMNQKIISIEKVLNSLHDNFTGGVGSSKKGATAENILLKNLTETFPDAEVIDVHHEKNAGDIHIIKDNKPKILIDSKHFDTTVPKKDLDKFYADIQLQNCSGILCNAFGGIANRKDFSIDFVDNNILIFIHNHKFDNSLFTLAVNIIYNMHEHIKDKQNDSVVIDQRLFNNLKIEYSFFLQSYDYHLEIIKTNINSLSKLKFTLLDHFFKRKSSTTNELKQFSCHLCSTGCSSDKALKRHYKEQHQIIFKQNEYINMNDSDSINKHNTTTPKRTKKALLLEQQKREQNPEQSQAQVFEQNPEQDLDPEQTISDINSENNDGNIHKIDF